MLLTQIDSCCKNQIIVIVANIRLIFAAQTPNNKMMLLSRDGENQSACLVKQLEIFTTLLNGVTLY